MKSTKTTFSKGLRALTMVGVFGLILGSFLIPLSRANADVVPANVGMTASPGTICAGESSELNWSSTDATSVTITPGIGSVTPYGHQNVSPTQTTTYTITGTNSTGGYSSGSITINVTGSCVTPPTVCQDVTAINYGGTLPCRYNQILNPTVNIYANPTSVSYNGASTITWSSTNATSCTASSGTNGWSGSKNLSGSFTTGALTYATTFNINCSNNTGSANDSVTVNVQNETCQDTTATNYGGTLPCRYQTQVCQDTTATNYGGTLPCRYQNNYTNASVSISADRTNISSNENTTIRWYPSNATSCYGSGGSNGWAGARSTFSDIFYTGPLTYTTTYTISCNNYNGGSDTRSVTVSVGNQIQIVNPASTLTAVTTPATLITTSSAQLNALILNSSINSYVNDSANAWFEWGTTMSLGNKTPTTSVGSLSSVRHASFLTGLRSGTTYYFRAVAENSSIRNIGSVLSFVTTTAQNTNTIIYRTSTPQTVIAPASLVLISSSVDRNQPIVPTIDNSRPHPGDEINYTVNYQNVGNAAITNLTLRINLPMEVDYMFSNPNNPTISGNTLVFSLGTLKANSQGVVTVRTRVRDNIPAGTNLNFPATLSYVDPSGQPQSVSANVSAQVWSEPVAVSGNAFLGANVFGAGFLPTNLFGWLLLLILIIILVLLAKYIFGSGQPFPFSKRTTTTLDQPLGKKTTTTTIQ